MHHQSFCLGLCCLVWPAQGVHLGPSSKYGTDGNGASLLANTFYVRNYSGHVFMTITWTFGNTYTKLYTAL